VTDKTRHQDRLRGILGADAKAATVPRREADGDGGEGACAAFGYLRGIRERADAIEFRLRNGNSVWFPYGWLGTWRYDPSEGLLLKFSGDLVYLVLIRGSNLDRPLSDSTINLTSAGLQRHRVLWVKEMSEEEVRQAGEAVPTVDSIRVAEFESHASLKEWLGEHAAGFLS
jgi:hypothetical protein